ncbi:MAG: HEAT repeat domain-containing protein [Planctomycetes bacterium]|nr:HEAT repeat domain-containing protein [Planctomycetota bacterium]
MRSRYIVHALSLYFATAALPADEVRMRDGTVHVGTTRVVGTQLEVKTRGGTVLVPQAQIARIRTDAELRDALHRLEAQVQVRGVHACLELARVARGFGLTDEMWRLLDAALRHTGSSEGAGHPRMAAFLGELEPEVLPRKWWKASPDVRVRELMLRLDRRSSKAKSLAVATLLARVPDAEPLLRRRARGDHHPERRIAALRALSIRQSDPKVPTALLAAILDHDPAVRQAAVLAHTAARGRTTAVPFFAKLLHHDQAQCRVRAAEALGMLRDPSALPHLIAAGPAAAAFRRKAPPAGSTRANVAVVQQESYLRDYDVEVAMASFIANPRVDVIQSGAVLDTTVVQVRTERVQIVRALRDAARVVSGADPGADPSRWAAWLAARQPAGR